MNTTLKFNFTLLWCRTFCCEFHIVYFGNLSWSYFSFMLLRIGWSILEKYLPQQKDLIPKNLAMPFLKGRDAAVIRSREVISTLKENLSSELNPISEKNLNSGLQAHVPRGLGLEENLVCRNNKKQIGATRDQLGHSLNNNLKIRLDRR